MISIQGDLFLYGNNVTRGPSYLTEAAQLSAVDTAHPLQFGLLSAFYVFTSPAASLDSTAEKRIQLQIWRLSNNATNEYRLVWQRLAVVNTSSLTGALLTVSSIHTSLFRHIDSTTASYYHTKQAQRSKKNLHHKIYTKNTIKNTTKTL